MAEIQLAQLDAMLGIGYALEGLRNKVQIAINQETAPSRGYLNWLDERVTQMEDKVKEMAAAPKSATEPSMDEFVRRFAPPEPKPWWKFW